jgi:hypothetical protein
MCGAKGLGNFVVRRSIQLVHSPFYFMIIIILAKMPSKVYLKVSLKLTSYLCHILFLLPAYAQKEAIFGIIISNRGRIKHNNFI